MAKKNPITTMGDAELTKLLGETREALRKHRYEAVASRPKNTNMSHINKRTIARILTEQKARLTK